MTKVENIEHLILLIRGQKVMLDIDLAKLYGVSTKRFPDDFIFRLNGKEKIEVVAKCDHLTALKFSPVLPCAFTEQGVAMLSSVLNSPKAVQVNIQIMRTFVKIRQLMASNAELAKKIEELERKYDGQFAVVFDAIRQLVEPAAPQKRKIGYTAEHQAKGGFLYERN